MGNKKQGRFFAGGFYADIAVCPVSIEVVYFYINRKIFKLISQYLFRLNLARIGSRAGFDEIFQ